MTFPVVVKKSGPITISKTGSASKAAMSPGSPASPINTSAKSTVKAAPATPVKKPSAAPKSPVAKPVTKPVSDAKPDLAAKTASTPVAKDTTKTKPPPLKLNIKAAEAKATPSSPATPKTAPKTPTTPSVKTLTASKSPAVVKSATAVRTTSTASLSKSPSVSSLTAKSPSAVSKTSSASSPTTKSSPSTIAKPTTPAAKSPSATAVSKAPAASSTPAKAPGTVGVKPTATPAAKSPPAAVTKPSTPTSKSASPAQKPLASKTPGTPTKTVLSKDAAPKKPAVSSSVKSATTGVVKSPASPATKTSPLSRSSSIASSIKSVTVRPAASPSKPLASAVKSPAKTVTPGKTAVTAKPLTPKTLVKKESSTLSLASVKSTATVRSTTSIASKSSAVSVKSALSKTAVAPKSPITKTVAKTAVPPKSPAVKASPTAAVSKTAVAPKSPAVKAAPTSTVSKTAVAPKSPAVKTAPTSTVSKTAVAPKSPAVKTAPTSTVSKTAVAPKSPAVKTAPAAAVSKTVTPKSPALKAAPTSAVSKTTAAPKSPAVKTPSSPAVKKTTPAKPLSSLGLSKTKSLSSSRLSSVSTESLASRTSLKSPMSPRPTTGVKSAAKPVKKVEEPKVKGIRGGQPVKKTIEIAGITELPTIAVADDTKQEVQDSLDVESSVALNDEVTPECVSNEQIESTIAETLDQGQVQSEETAEVLACDVEDDQVQEVSESNLETIVEDLVESALTVEVPAPESSVGSCCSPIDFEVVQIEDCQPRLDGVTQSDDNCSIEFVENHFDTNGRAAAEAEPETCVIDMEDQFEPMNDKLVLGDVPYETDSNKSDTSDHEQAVQVEATTADVEENVFSFTAESVEENDRIADFVEQFVCQQPMADRSEGPSSLSTDDGSLVSRKSYSEVVMGSPKDGEYYFDYDIELADDCLDDDEEDKPVFVEVTEKEFPELKPKDLSGKRKRMRKQKKRNYSCRSESQSDSYNSVPEIEYNPEDFDGNEFCHYIKMMKDCSFYPNGTFSSDSVKLSTSESLSWLDISVRTTDDELRPSTELLSTYEVFQASNLSKDFLTSIIGTTTTTQTTNEPTWFWKSIEGRHQMHNKANITLSLQPRPKHLTTPRFMTLLALISEAKGYQIEPSLSEHFVTTDCMPRFNDKIKRLMVQGFWLIGRLITESLSEDEEVSCGNPFEFCDGDIGYWWAGINMLDWQEYMKKCGKSQTTHNCYQFMLDENMEGYRHINNEAVSNMNAAPEDFMSELDVENFIHTVRNVKYYCGNCFVDSQENVELEASNESCDSDSLVEWDNSTNNMSNESE